MVHGKNRISYRIDRRLTSLAGPDDDATISFGLPFEPEDSQYGEYRMQNMPNRVASIAMRMQFTIGHGSLLEEERVQTEVPHRAGRAPESDS